MLDMHVRFGCPPGFDPDEAELERIDMLGAASVELSPASAGGGARRPRSAHRHVGVDGAGERQGRTPAGVRGLHRRHRR